MNTEALLILGVLGVGFITGLLGGLIVAIFLYMVTRPDPE